MEEAVHRNIADCVRGTGLVYAAQVNDEEATIPHPKKCQKAISGMLRTADNKMVKQITRPHELITSRPASCRL